MCSAAYYAEVEGGAVNSATSRAERGVGLVLAIRVLPSGVFVAIDKVFDALPARSLELIEKEA